jgi:hypothetical protein
MLELNDNHFLTMGKIEQELEENILSIRNMEREMLIKVKCSDELLESIDRAQPVFVYAYLPSIHEMGKIISIYNVNVKVEDFLKFQKQLAEVLGVSP